ncbi:PMU1 [Malassezia furfur]|nr:PMU1 [Malassezia furfur]
MSRASSCTSRGTAKGTTYGSAAWESHHAKRFGDDTLTWGPDPALTPLGYAQAEAVREAWRAALAGPDPPPVPTVLCSSPLRRSLDTAAITWDAIDAAPSTLYIYEDLRERRTRSQIAQAAPMRVVFADRFVEADEMWTVRQSLTQPARESDDAMRARVHRVLESIWEGVGRDAKGRPVHSSSPKCDLSWGCDAAHL